MNKHLNRTAAAILTARYHGLTLEATAEVFGIDRTDVRHIEAKALRRLLNMGFGVPEVRAHFSA